MALWKPSESARAGAETGAEAGGVIAFVMVLLAFVIMSGGWFLISGEGWRWKGDGRTDGGSCGTNIFMPDSDRESDSSPD